MFMQLLTKLKYKNNTLKTLKKQSTNERTGLQMLVDLYTICLCYEEEQLSADILELFSCADKSQINGERFGSIC